jgi:hypothetical protein
MKRVAGSMVEDSIFHWCFVLPRAGIMLSSETILQIHWGNRPFFIFQLGIIGVSFPDKPQSKERNDTYDCPGSVTAP